MSQLPSKWVCIDDVDPRIEYSEGWTDGPDLPSQIQLADLGNWGSAFNGTLHTITTQGSFSFRFEGSAIQVYGTNIVDSSTPSSSNAPYSCSIDGQLITPVVSGAGNTENHWLFCSQDNLNRDPHTLTVKVNGSVSPFRFDNIQYVPNSEVDFSKAFTLIDNLDPSIEFDNSWTSWRDIANLTKSSGGSMSVKFNGSSATWYGAIDSAFNQGNMTVEYTIDGGPAMKLNFTPPPKARNLTQYNQIYFSTPILTGSGTHTLSVTYNGDANSVPLSLDYLIIRNHPNVLASTNVTSISHPSLPPATQTSSVPIISTTLTSSTFSNPSTVTVTSPSNTTSWSSIAPHISSGVEPSSNSTHSNSFPVKYIIAVVVGGVGLLSVLLLLGLYVHRKRTRNQLRASPYSSSSADQSRAGFMSSETSLVPYEKVSESMYANHLPRLQPVRRLPDEGSAGLPEGTILNIPHTDRNRAADSVADDDNDTESTMSLQPQRLTIHEDSGVRIPTHTVTDIDIVDSLPPHYTRDW
ncbi:hypothetical protein CVT24_002203 [Panaeolus cyanescens]|uniref:Uncharacterized protein n=1 Tax=Panaeolus cyanescens TaxID=181874 RepID=A0A409WV70_9AGAR|nr:hypothetical protein CVT24_002203 [Panaeolus cyanescens]